MQTNGVKSSQPNEAEPNGEIISSRKSKMSQSELFIDTQVPDEQKEAGSKIKPQNSPVQQNGHIENPLSRVTFQNRVEEQQETQMIDTNVEQSYKREEDKEEEVK